MDQNGQFVNQQFGQPQFAQGQQFVNTGTGMIDPNAGVAHVGSVPIDPTTGEEEPVFFLHGQPEADFKWAPEGRAQLRIQEASAKRTNTADKSSMLSLKLAIEGMGEQLDGIMVFDRLIVEKGKPGAGMGVKKAKGLGLPIDSPTPISLNQIAQSLVGKLLWADLSVKPRMDKDATTGQYTVPVTTIRDGKKIAVMQNEVENYYVHNVAAGGVPAGAVAQPGVVQAPVQQTFAQPGYMNAPQQGIPAGAVQQYLTQGTPVPLQTIPGQNLAPVGPPAAALQAPQQLQQPIQQSLPIQQMIAPGQVAQFPVQIAPQGAPNPWAAQGQAVAAPVESAKKGKKA